MSAPTAAPRPERPGASRLLVGCALVGVGFLLVVLLLPARAAADGRSLFGGPRPRPGPAVLYAPPARAPQLENAPPWRAAPLLVSGASAYVHGEFLYQDWLYDDHGARAPVRDPGDGRLLLGFGERLGPSGGSYTYPTAPAYAGNAADILELRVKPLRAATAVRLTLNTLRDPARVGVTLALGGSRRPQALPFGANVSAPAELFLTVHGRRAVLARAASDRVIRPAPRVAVDLRRRQIDLRIPHRAWDPGRRVVPMAAGVGLWDRERGRYMLPGVAATPSAPGGGGGLARPAAFFNVAFRAREPFPRLANPGPDGVAWWRDAAQGVDLARGDLSAFRARVDFARLRRGATDFSHVPRTGPIDRIFASHTATGDGFDPRGSCLNRPDCLRGQIRGRLQPYALYVPPRRRPGERYGLTLLLHSVTATYNQFLGTANQRQLALRRGGRSLVLTPEARGGDGFYRDRAAADVFEAWADVARRYRLNPRRSAISGYSMGAWGTVKLAAQFPDLFARAEETVGEAGMVPLPQLASLRWVPLLMLNIPGDQAYERMAEALEDLGLRFELDELQPLAGWYPDLPFAQHMTVAVGDEYRRVARFLGGAETVRDPPHVTHVVNPALDRRRSRLLADHAYWISAVRVRGRGLGVVDAVSWGPGRADPVPDAIRRGSGLLPAGRLGPRSFRWTLRRWGAAPRRPRRDRLDVRLENVASLTVDARRAGLTCAARVRLLADGPVRVRLAGCARLIR